MSDVRIDYAIEQYEKMLDFSREIFGDWYDESDWGKWAFDFYTEVEELIRKALESGKPFDTDWRSFRKSSETIHIERFVSGEINVRVTKYMDPLEDGTLIWDAVYECDEHMLTDEIIAEIQEEVCRICGTDLHDFEFTEATETLPADATYEQIIKTAENLSCYTDDDTEKRFRIVQDTTKRIIEEHAKSKTEN